MKNLTLDVVFSDQLFGKHPFKDSTTVYLDPVGLYEWTDWTEFEEQPDVLNKIYGQLFDEVVLNQKKVVCFWPLTNPGTQSWFEMLSLSALPHVSLHTVLTDVRAGLGYDLDPKILSIWQDLLTTMLGSLAEDLSINQQFEEIGTLSSATHSFVLFRTENQSGTQYGFEDIHTFEARVDGMGDTLELGTFITHYYDTIEEMLGALSNFGDLSDFSPEFYDKGLEKQFFKLLLSENKPLNLIQKWLVSYSLN